MAIPNIIVRINSNESRHCPKRKRWVAVKKAQNESCCKAGREKGAYCRPLISTARIPGRAEHSARLLCFSCESWQVRSRAGQDTCQSTGHREGGCA
jgi:hypothetical protein